MRSFKYIAIFFSFFILFNAEAQKENRQILLNIEGEKISVGDFIKAYHKSNAISQVGPHATVGEYLELYINFRLKVMDARRQKLDTIQRLKSELTGYRNQLAETYFFDKETDDKLLEEAYNRLLTDIRASHILIRCPLEASPEDTLIAYQKINDIRQKALKGESFKELAIKYSDDMTARDQTDNRGNIVNKGNAGDLGYFTVFDMVYSFESAAYNTPLGSVSQPVRTQFGYHLLNVTDKHEALGEAKTAQIFLANPVQNPVRENVKNRIYDIYNKLSSGANFEKIVREFSEDQNSKLNNGIMNPFVANDLVPEFYLAIFNIDSIGHYSEPFQTPYGWHIIKLISRKKPSNFNDEKEELSNRIKKDLRAELSKKAKLEQIKHLIRLKSYSRAKDDLYQLIDTNLLAGKWEKANAGETGQRLLKIGKHFFTQNDFINYITKNQVKTTSLHLKSYYDYLYDGFVNEKCKEYYFDQLEIIEPEFQETMQEYNDGILLFELSERNVWKKSMDDKIGLRSFFKSQQSKYQTDDFNTVKGLVISDYQDFLEKEWIKELRARFSVKINKKALNQII